MTNSVEPDFDSEEIDTFLELLVKGVTMDTAAAASGLMIQNVYYWLRRGEVEIQRPKKAVKKTEEVFVRFYEEAIKCVAKANAKAEMAITNAMGDDWRAASFWLEKNMPEKYGKEAASIKAIQARVEALEG